MHPYKVDKATPIKVYGCIGGVPPRLTYRDGQEDASPCFAFLHLLHLGAKNEVQQGKYP